MTSPVLTTGLSLPCLSSGLMVISWTRPVTFLQPSFVMLFVGRVSMTDSSTLLAVLLSLWTHLGSETILLVDGTREMPSIPFAPVLSMT